MHQDILGDGDLLQSALDLGLGRRFIIEQDNDPKDTAKITQSGFMTTLCESRWEQTWTQLTISGEIWKWLYTDVLDTSCVLMLC